MRTGAETRDRRSAGQLPERDPVRVELRPVDAVDVTTLVDNSSDVLLPDVGPVRRWGPPDRQVRSRSSPAIWRSDSGLSTSSERSTGSPY